MMFDRAGRLSCFTSTRNVILLYFVFRLAKFIEHLHIGYGPCFRSTRYLEPEVSRDRSMQMHTKPAQAAH